MEWREPDDGAWDGPADGRVYPTAPLPAHERQWRHPSEMGQAAWVSSEPPLALGRGLMAATSVIGCAIGLAILWLMVPSRGGFGPSAGPVVTRSLLPGSTERVAVLAPLPGDDIGNALVTTTLSIAALLTDFTLPAEDVSFNTVQLEWPDARPVAVAVVIDEAPFIVTTARAVGSDGTVTVRLESGATATAEVVSIDDALAYIQPGALIDTVGFGATAALHDGDTVTVLGHDPIALTYGDAAELAMLADAGIAEGTPVVDERGALVALCTWVDNAIALVHVAPDEVSRLVVPAAPAPSTSLPAAPRPTPT